MAYVSALYIYPLKSCAGVGVGEAAVLAQGLGLEVRAPGGAVVSKALDRQWCVCDDAGLVQGQSTPAPHTHNTRAHPARARVHAEHPPRAVCLPVRPHSCHPRPQDIRVQPKMVTIAASFEPGPASPRSPAAVETLVLTAPADPELPALRLPVAEEAYGGNATVMVSDRHSNKWFGRPLAVRLQWLGLDCNGVGLMAPPSCPAV